MTIKDDLKNLKIKDINNYNLYLDGIKLKYSNYKKVLNYNSDLYIIQVRNSVNIINIIYKYNN